MEGRGSGGVELGFAEAVGSLGPVLACRSWGQWDGGKLGGRPLWLTLGGGAPLPSCACGACGQPLLLLAQVYAPLEDAEAQHDDAYHRALYVLACARGACVNVAGRAGGVRVLRSQLPRANALLPPNADDAIERPAWVSTPESPLCCLCGFPAPSRCARCRGPRYCSRAHQLAHWRLGHKGECAAAGGAGEAGAGGEAGAAPLALALRAGAVLPEWDIAIDEEPSAAARALHAERSLPPEAAKALRALRSGGSAVPAAPAGEEEGGEPLSITGLSQRELNEAVGSSPAADAALVEFEVRTACAQDQVLRYSGWWPSAPPAPPAPAPRPSSGGAAAVQGGEEEEEEEEEGEGFAEGPGVPLWFSSAAQPAPGDIPACARCGAARVFELQVMPQALHFALGAGVEEAAVSLDFGTVAIYTCSRSCPLGAEVPLVEEVAWVQTSGEKRDKGEGAAGAAAAPAAAQGAGMAGLD